MKSLEGMVANALERNGYGAEMHDYEVETVHTIKVIQRRTITAVNMVAAQKLSNMQWEVYPDEQFKDGVAFVRKERSELQTKITKVGDTNGNS